jgi:hypothetical protein
MQKTTLPSKEPLQDKKKLFSGWEEIGEDYEVIKLLGRGSYG